MSRILVLSPFPPPPDGIGNHAEHLVNAWRGTDHEVLVLAMGDGSLDARSGGYDVHRILNLGNTKAASRAGWAFQPDVVFCQYAISALTTSLETALGVCRAFKAAGTPVAMGFHEPPRELRLLGPLGRILYGRAIDACSIPVVFSTGARDALSWRLDASSILLVPHGIPSLKSPSEAERERVRTAFGLTGPFILNFGFVHPDKGLDVLVDAAPLLTGLVGHQVPIVMAGSPRTRTSVFKIMGLADERHDRAVHAAAARFSETTTIRFLDYLAFEDLIPLLGEASVVVLPYRRTTQSGVASYVLGAGAPTVASNLPGLVEAFGDAALYVEPEDPASLARGLAATLSDDALRLQLTSAARRAQHEKSYGVVARSILEAAERSDHDAR